MKKARTSTLLFIPFILHILYSQSITNIQQKTENGRIVITYDFQGGSGEVYNVYNIILRAEKEGTTIHPRVAVGDVRDVSPGKDKEIWWEPVLEGRTLAGWQVSLKAEKSLFSMIWVPGGAFEMGCGSWTSECDSDEKPVHTVTVNSFYMSATEVTQA